jgi:hypothetical protein
MKTPDYMSYSRYKKNKKVDSNKGIMIGVTTFFATLLIFTIVVTNLSPDVDVTIGKDTDMEAKESGLGVKRFIDDRLKMIQMEDSGAGASKSIEDKKTAAYEDESFDSFSRELDEKVELPSKTRDNSELNEQNTTARSTPPRPNKNDDLATPFESPRMAKVYVGYYNTADQAKVAQGILLDSGLSVTPFVKDLGGAYTLQVGSYSSRSKAESLASELLKNNFPARVIQE